MVINAPSLANISTLDFGKDVQKLYDGGVRFVHLDIIDGHYAKNLCYPVSTVKDIKGEYPDMTVEVHLMVDNPLDYVEILKVYNADYVAFHLDSTNFALRTVSAIKAAGMKAGVVINPSQRIDIIEPVADILDYVILMGVEPGFAGQKFLPRTLERLKELALYRKKMNYRYRILIDGGVSYDVAEDCVRSGADILVTGIYIVFKQKDGITAACKRFENHMENIKSEI